MHPFTDEKNNKQVTGALSSSRNAFAQKTMAWMT